jgi:hypothetical protein
MDYNGLLAKDYNIITINIIMIMMTVPRDTDLGLNGPVQFHTLFG